MEMSPNGHEPTTNERLLTEIIDSAAVQNPSAVWLRYPGSNDPSEYFDITYRQLAGAVNNLAWFLQENVTQVQSFEPVVYIGPQDARYPIFTYACIKAGFKAVFLSPRNSKASNMSLISSLGGSHLVTTDPPPMASQQLQCEESIHTITIPSLEKLLAGSSKPFPFHKTFADAKRDPFVVLHTSGSTGNPKPITYTHEFWTRNANAFQMPVPAGSESIASLFHRSRLLCLLPLFHMAGFCFATVMSHFFQTTIVLPAANAPLSTHTLARSVEHAGIDWAAVAPSIVEDLGRDPSSLEAVSKRLKCLAFGGGKPSVALGDIVSRRIRVHNLIGSSECGGFAQLLPSEGSPKAELWPYVAFHPHVNAKFEQHSADSHELVIKRHRGQDEPLQANQAIFLQCPDQDEYRTSDLFRQHPEFPDLWQHQGRIDDLVVFSNGEKTNPVAYEQQVASHADVTGAVVFGTNQREAGILIEPSQHEEDPATFVDKIGAAVEASNETAPAYARVAKSHICVTSPDKPMARSAKGTVRRHQTIQLYEKEIAALYEASEGETDGATEESSCSPTDLGEVTAKVRGAVVEVTKAETIQNQDDLFALGVDSLQVSQIARRLQSNGFRTVKPKMVYANGSIDKLAGAIHQPASCTGADSQGRREAGLGDTTAERLSTLEQTLALYTEKARKLGEVNLYQATRPSSDDAHLQDVMIEQEEECVLVTGSTGYLGSYILDQLIRDEAKPSRRVICLNRAHGGSEAQVARNKEHDSSLLLHFSSSRVEFLTGDFDNAEPAPDLGLCPEKLRQLLGSVTTVIHNAWPVDFNLPLSGFQSSLDFLLSLVRFCQQARHSPSLLLISSIASVHNYGNKAGGIIPEGIVTELRAPEPGYGESKFLAEHILREAMAGDTQTFAASVVRVGQLAGPANTEGLWNRRDWVPRLVRSCLPLSAIPADLGMNDEISWVPIDLAASIILEIASHVAERKDSLGVYQLLNPATVSWGQLVPEIQAVLTDARNASTLDAEDKGVNGPATPGEGVEQQSTSLIQVVTGKEWLRRLHQSDQQGSSSSDTTENPALDLVDFFDGIFAVPERSRGKAWATHETAQASPTFRALTSIQPAWMRRWVQGWLGDSKKE